MGELSKSSIIYDSDNYSSNDKIHNEIPKKQWCRVDFTAIADNRVQIKFKYNASIINEIKKVVGRRYCVDTKTWTIPNQHYKTLLENINEIRNNEKDIQFIINDLGVMVLEDEISVVNLMLRDDKIYLSLQNFDSNFIIQFKNLVKSSKFHPDTKEWSLNVEDMHLLKRIVYDANYKINFKDNDVHKIFFSA